MASNTLTNSPESVRKTLWIIRHGQAVHNPRAEQAKDNGCTHEQFIELMRQDDALDAELTELGRKQAKACKMSSDKFQLILSSPLSRAIETADIVAPPTPSVKRVVLENLREINGMLLNAQRRSVSELSKKFYHWDYHEIAEKDELWTETLETQADCAERGYKAFRWILERPEQNIFLACHGGILRFSMQEHPLIKVADARSSGNLDRPPDARFGNCEVRKYTLQESAGEKGKPIILLTEVDITDDECSL